MIQNLKHKYLPVLACMFCIHCSAQNGFVKLSNNHITDTTGNTLKLRGVKLGGWLLWEGWIPGGGFKKETVIKQKLTELAGETATQEFIKSYYKNYITEAAIHAIASAGFNGVRLPFNYRILNTQDPAAPGFALIDSLISWCRKNGLYIIPDLHAAPGGQNHAFICDPEKTNFGRAKKILRRQSLSG